MSYSLEAQTLFLHPAVEVTFRPADEVSFISERGRLVLNGALYRRMVSLFDGKRPVAEVVEQLRLQASTSEIYYALMQLAGMAIMVDENNDPPAELANFWQFMAANPSLRFKPHLRLATLPPDLTFLLSEREQFTLQGPIYYRLLPLLNGQHKCQELYTLLEGHLSTADIYYILFRLNQKGYLTVESEMLSTQTSFWQAQGFTTFQKDAVSVLSFSSVPASALLNLLTSLNIQTDSEGDLTAVIVDDYLQAELAEFNQQALVTRRPWLLCKPVGTILWVGPVFRHGETGCWYCLAHRLRANRQIETFVQGQHSSSPPPLPPQVTLPTTVSLGLNLAATEISRWLTGVPDQPIANAILTLDVHTLQTQVHPLPRRPQCLACGNRFNEREQTFVPIKLARRQKVFAGSGGYRVSPSEQMVEQYSHLISPITGVVTNLQQLALTGGYPTGRDLIHIYQAEHNFGLNPHSWEMVRNSLRTRGMGKGTTDRQARASALGEALERHSGLFHGDEIRQTSNYQALGTAAIHPHCCLNYSQTQYARRHQLNATGSRYLTVPEPFDETAEIEWSPVWSLTNNTVRYIPTSYGYYQYPAPTQHYFCRADSNGNAAGSCLEEAILQGFMELVERDGVSLWWYNRLRRPAVDLFSFAEPYLQNLVAFYESMRRELWVLDLTSDLGIPIFAALSRRIEAPTEDIIFGFGAHFDPKIGILRAVTEMNQSLPFVLNSKDDPQGYQLGHQEARVWWQTATVSQQPYLLPDSQIKPKVQADYETVWNADLQADVERCVDLAQQRGLETLVLDQTRPDIGLTVVKVIVPGLRHFWPRFGPGRLYDVPVKLGWLVSPLAEQQLNPQHIFI